ncbi:MAG: universal stress protein [Woeseiaceae bacterium]|nr:universal stress protein [Woeseiaceae bacterium]
MKRFSKILLIADSALEKSAAFKRAVDLAKTNQAALTVIDTVREIQGDMQMAIVALPYDELTKIAVAEKSAKLEKVVTASRELGVDMSADVLIGKPFLEIIKKVVRENYDLVIKTENQKSGLKKSIFGSTDMNLMRKCPCPVWITKSNGETSYRCIVAAVDNDPEEPVTSELNQQILEMSFSLALSESSDLHIVNAWYFEYESYLRSPHIGLSEDEVDEIVEGEFAARKAWLKQVVEKYGVTKGTDQIKYVEPVLHVVKGEPSATVAGIAAEFGADLVVMGSVGRTGISGFFMGNTAEDIVAQLECSILTVKPPGFESPVAG